MNGIDPILNLAFAMKNNPGAYAVLLGAGISKSAGIPTGWEIKEDLLKQLKAFGSDFSDTTGYGELLQALQKTQAERMAMLKQYFEPNEEDRAEGRKQPTAAHKAIASLIQKGYVRVVITTNFDRLLEQALQTIGISPNVVWASEMLAGTPPLRHAPITIVKLHGDYLDVRSLNTPTELEKYDDKWNEILDTVFHEYGLIVCGWSAQWDNALRGAIHRNAQPWYANYWIEPLDLTTHGTDTTNHMKANLIKKTADETFPQLSQNIEVLEHFPREHPMTVAMARERTMRLLSNESASVELDQLLREQAESTYKEFTTEIVALTPNDLNKQIDEIISFYFAKTEVFLNIACTLFWYTNDKYLSLIRQISSRWVTPKDHNHEYGDSFWKICALYLLYVCGIIAVWTDNWRFIHAILYSKARSYRRAKTSLFLDNADKYNIIYLDPRQRGFHQDILSSRIKPVLRQIFSGFIPSDVDYNVTFDIFEMLLTVIRLENETSWINHDISMREYADRWDEITAYWSDRGSKGSSWEFCQLFFDGSPEQLKNTLERYAFTSKQISQFIDFPDYAKIYMQEIK